MRHHFCLIPILLETFSVRLPFVFTDRLSVGKHLPLLGLQVYSNRSGYLMFLFSLFAIVKPFFVLSDL